MREIRVKGPRSNTHANGQVNNTVVTDTSDGHAQDMDGAAVKMSWEVFGLEPYQHYTASVEFFDAASGQIVGGATRTSLMLPYYDPKLDPPHLRLVYPVPRAHAEYPSVQGEMAALEAMTDDDAPVRVGQASVMLLISAA